LVAVVFQILSRTVAVTDVVLPKAVIFATPWFSWDRTVKV
jgi:hypothetical protein